MCVQIGVLLTAISSMMHYLELIPCWFNSNFVEGSYVPSRCWLYQSPAISYGFQRLWQSVYSYHLALTKSCLASLGTLLSLYYWPKRFRCSQRSRCFGSHLFHADSLSNEVNFRQCYPSVGLHVSLYRSLSICDDLKSCVYCVQREAGVLEGAD